MSVTAIARRYAEALADVAVEGNQVEQIDAEVRAFTEMMAASRELYDVLASPALSQKEKSRVLESLIERTRPGKMTANLLRTLLRNYRLHYLDVVHEQFRREINRRRGVVPAEVTTAGPVAPEDRQVLTNRLEEMTGNRVEIEFRTDPSLIGGAVARIGSVVYDGSIRTQLQTVRQKLKQD
ncbi:MAG: ATP synthase F1 subunit delta [Acidobacteriota bacterium]